MTAGLAEFALAGDSFFANLVRILTSSGSATPQLTIFFGVFFLVTLAIFVWAAFLRKPKSQRPHRHHRHHRHHDSEPAEPAPAPNVPDYEIPPRRHNRPRRRKRKQLPRNPTLAETGGLPPVRDDGSEPPAPPI